MYKTKLDLQKPLLTAGEGVYKTKLDLQKPLLTAGGRGARSTKAPTNSGGGGV